MFFVLKNWEKVDNKILNFKNIYHFIFIINNNCFTRTVSDPIHPNSRPPLIKMSFEVCTSDDKSNFFTAEAKIFFNDGDENRKNENENKNESNNTSVVNDIVFFNSVSGASFPSVDSKIDCCLGQDKKVTFFDDEVEKHDARLDKDRSRQQLSLKITYLTDKVKTVQNQVQAEKVKRKKKEQSLLKLATELKKRSIRKQKDEQRMEEVCTYQCSLFVEFVTVEENFEIQIHLQLC